MRLPLKILLYFDLRLLNFRPEDLIDNQSALFQVMAWGQTDVEPLPESRITQFTNAYIHRNAGFFRCFFKSLKSIWSLRAIRLYMPVPDPQMNFNDLKRMTHIVPV